MAHPREAGISPTDLTIFERFPILEGLRRRPKTVLLIPDGNGRWAKEHGLPTVEGHRKGAEVLVNLLNFFVELPGTKDFILWGFSHDNWTREENEVDDIMNVMTTALVTNMDFFDKYQVRFFRLGSEETIPNQYPGLWEALCETEEHTRNYNFKKLTLAVDFSGEDQEVRVAKKIVDLQIPTSKLVTTGFLASLRDGHGLIGPADLVIRTSGEQRTSDLGWLGKNSEFWTTNKYLPDFVEEDCVQALVDFSKRERRFGGRPGV